MCVKTYFKVTPCPYGHFCPNLILKHLWTPPLTDTKPGNAVLNNVIVVALWWFYFSLSLVVFSRSPTKNMNCLCNIKKKKSTWGIENMAVKWMIVCQKKFTSFCFSSMWVHATNRVQCSLLIPRDQLSVIANLIARYRQEAETVELYLMELHLRKSFGRERRVRSIPKRCTGISSRWITCCNHAPV